MARPLRIQFSGAFYHITCRGIERRNIYVDDKDRDRFLTLLFESLENYQVILYAYILMRNHFHLIIQTRKGNCSEFMRHFNICYTGWFNWRHHRCGNLYQGRYKAFLIDVDNYLLEVSRYLHLNCVRVRNLKSLDYQSQWRYVREYRWSSLAGYVSEHDAVQAVDYDLILSMIDGRRAYRAFMRDGLKWGVENPFKKVKSQVILGGEEFVKEVKQYLKRGSRREQPSYRDMVTSVLDPEVVMGALTRACGIKEELLKQRGAHGVLRGIVADLLYKYCEITQGQIGAMLGDIDYVSVHQLRRRMREKMFDSEEIKRRYEAIEAQLKQLCTM
jgi:putative transposase